MRLKMHFGIEIEDIVGFISIIFMLHALISLLFSEFLFDIFMLHEIVSLTPKISLIIDNALNILTNLFYD